MLCFDKNFNKDCGICGVSSNDQKLTTSAMRVCIFVYLSDYVGKMNGAGIPGIIAVSYCGRPVFRVLSLSFCFLSSLVFLLPPCHA